MTALKDFIELKKKVEHFGRMVDRTAGAIEQMMTRFKNEFGCSTLEAAKKMAIQLKKQRQKAKDDFLEEKEKFEEKYELDND